jgi:hypothetical protein
MQYTNVGCALLQFLTAVLCGGSAVFESGVVAEWGCGEFEGSRR